jgi:hypothetical protein
VTHAPRCCNFICARRAGFPTRKAFRPFAQRYKLLLRSARPGVVVSDLSDEVGGRCRACMQCLPICWAICGEHEMMWSSATSLLLCALLTPWCLPPGPQASGELRGVEPSSYSSLLLSALV